MIAFSHEKKYLLPCTWSVFEAVRPVPRGSRLHLRYRFLEPYHEIADQSRMLLLLAAVTLFGILGSFGISSINLPSSNLIF